jgi:hypothetical protein
VDLGRFFSLIYTQSVELLGRGISPSQDRYLHTEQDKRRIKADTDIPSGIRTPDHQAANNSEAVHQNNKIESKVFL